MSDPRPPAFLRQLLTKVEAGFHFVRQFFYFKHYMLISVFLLAGLGFWFSYEFRFDFQVPEAFADQRLILLPYVAALKLLLFYLLGAYASNWRYIGLSDIPSLLLYCATCTGILFVSSIFGIPLRIPRGVILIDFFITIVLIGGTLISMRFFREKIRVRLHKSDSPDVRQAVVIGAGDAGEMIIREIGKNPHSGLQVRAIFDDDRSKIGSFIHGIRVVGTAEDVPLYVGQNLVHTAIVAIPSADRIQMKRIYNLLKDLNISVKTLPGLNEIIEGSSTLTQLRDITISDLLAREEVHIDTQQVFNLVFDKVVLVTGAGGSIGSELSRQIFRRKPSALLLMDRAENNLFHIHRQLVEQAGNNGTCNVAPILCDAGDETRVRYEFERFRPELVFHAAAYKHVPMQELNAVECFKNNVGATSVLARASDAFGVSHFLLISSDKAVNPTSVMGATKRVCEIYCQALARTSHTKFLSVRFGNVLASEGSVVPIFLEQIAKGGPVTITHPEMRRYFMTIPEAVTLVLQAAALGETGQIMVLEMGDPIKIVDLVQHLLQLVGKDKDGIPIKYVGLRPGEKLFEEVCSSDEICMQTGHSKIKVYKQNGGLPVDITRKIDEALKVVTEHNDPVEVNAILKETVPEYLTGKL